MSDDEWDVSDSEVPAAPQKVASKWDDEDVEENTDVKDSWDAESDDDSSSKSKPEPVKKASPPIKKKTTLQQKLAERKQQEEEEKARRIAERAESELERKERLRRAEIESDLENVRALVGDLGVANAPPSLITGTNLSNMQPSNRAELLEYAEMLQKKTMEFEDQAAYAVFVEAVVRNLVASLNVDDTRKISSCLTAITNEKQKQLKELQGKGKKKASAKKTVNVARGGEFENYADDTYNEFDDFM